MPISEEIKNVFDDYLGKEHLGNIKCGYLSIMGEINPKLSNLPVFEGGEELYNFSVYEYQWTLSLTREISRPQGRTKRWTNKLTEKDAILVQVFFHTSDTKYSVKVLTGTIMPPFMIKRNLREFLGDKWMKYTGAVVQSFGKYSKVSMIGQIGSEITNTIAQFEKDAVPTSYSYPWYSKTVTTYEENEKQLKQLNGVEWHINKRAFRNLGNQLNGAFRVIFIESSEKGSEIIKLETRARITFKRPILRFDRLRNNDLDINHEIWMPWSPNYEDFSDDKRLCLDVKPIGNSK